jgi:putative chitinase
MNLDKLKGKLDGTVLSQIPEVMKKFGINTPLRLAHFLSQCAHESGNFRLTEENLNYSSRGLLGVFPKYFNATTADLYARKPEKIANIVYASRMGNGDKSTGDGWKFRGRGYIQLTGRNNYVEFSKAINEDMTMSPDTVAKKYPMLSAAWFFSKTKLNEIADKGDSIDTVTMITKKINGGTIGIEDRIKKFREYYELLK